MTDVDSFWSARPILTHIRTLARSRRVGPWAVLGTAMARAVATIPAQVALPGTVGGRMSLNLFVALVGASGAGKGGADAAGMAGITFAAAPVDSVPLGSGEGASRTFRPLGTPAEAPNPVTAVIFTVPEIDTLTALTNRQGATLSAELRKLYSGEALGFANAGKDPDAPEQRPRDPSPWPVPGAAWPSTGASHLRLLAGHGDLVIPSCAIDMIDAHRLAVLRGDHRVDPLDGHALLCRLKIAAALMALDGRTSVADTDWQLAGPVMEVSAATRGQCRHALTQQHRSQNTARALATVERDQIVAERKSHRARDAILRKLAAGQELTSGELRRALKVDIRDHYDAALTKLLDRGEIKVSPGTHGHRQVPVYHRYTPEKHAPSTADDACTTGTRVPAPHNTTAARISRPRPGTPRTPRLIQQTTEATA